jgi:hypothetical protein
MASVASSIHASTFSTTGVNTFSLDSTAFPAVHAHNHLLASFHPLDLTHYSPCSICRESTAGRRLVHAQCQLGLVTLPALTSERALLTYTSRWVSFLMRIVLCNRSRATLGSSTAIVVGRHHVHLLPMARLQLGCCHGGGPLHAATLLLCDKSPPMVVER